MRNARSFEKEELEIGDLCHIVKGKYQGYRGKIERFTPWKIVVCLVEWDARVVMIWQTSVKPCEMGVRLVMGPVRKGDAVRIVCGKYGQQDGTVVRVHPWMVTVRLPVLDRDVRVYQTSVRLLILTTEETRSAMSSRWQATGKEKLKRKKYISGGGRQAGIMPSLSTNPKDRVPLWT
jgi:ribosomal protein L24